MPFAMGFQPSRLYCQRNDDWFLIDDERNYPASAVDVVTRYVAQPRGHQFFPIYRERRRLRAHLFMRCNVVWACAVIQGGNPLLTIYHFHLVE